MSITGALHAVVLKEAKSIFMYRVRENWWTFFFMLYAVVKRSVPSGRSQHLA